MQASSVVENVDILADDLLRLVQVGEVVQTSAFELEGREQALGDSVDAQQSPLRLRLRITPAASSRAMYSSNP